MLKRFSSAALFLFLSAALLPVFCRASEGGSHHGGAGILGLIPYWVNFIIYVGILYFLLKNTARRFWAGRREGISQAIQNAATELQNAANELRIARERFDNVEEESHKIKEIIRKEAIVEHDAILTDARMQCERAIQRAHETVASERSQAEAALRRELAEHVIVNATRRLKDHTSLDSDKSRRESVMDGFKQMINP